MGFYLSFSFTATWISELRENTLVDYLLVLVKLIRDWFYIAFPPFRVRKTCFLTQSEDWLDGILVFANSNLQEITWQCLFSYHPTFTTTVWRSKKTLLKAMDYISFQCKYVLTVFTDYYILPYWNWTSCLYRASQV